MELFRIMPCRYETIKNTIEGYERTGVPLIAYKDECTFHNTGAIPEYGPACFADDPGACYFIPKLVEIFDIEFETPMFENCSERSLFGRETNLYEENRRWRLHFVESKSFLPDFLRFAYNLRRPPLISS